jgi:nucleoside-diphosphate-sugar epimerase
MKIVVIGGTGLIGSRLVNKLRDNGHDGVSFVQSAAGENSIPGGAG